MVATPDAVTRLVGEFSRLPGIGPKTASRLAYYLLRAPIEQVKSLGAAITELRDRITFCSQCYNITEDDPCPLCAGDRADRQGTTSLAVTGPGRFPPKCIHHRQRWELDTLS